MQIINAVCARRLQKIETAFEANNHGVSSTIRLSPELATAFVKQISKHTSEDLFFRTADFKMQYVFQGHPWTIVSADRDAFLCPNDADVEEEMLAVIAEHGKAK